MIRKAKKILNEVFGYRSFLPLQEEIIKSLLERKDTLVVLPTGGGKSLCYQLPALIFEGITIVISPLISLMKDQVSQLSELDFPAVLLNSQLSPQEYRRNITKIKDNKAKLLYVAPETFLKPNIMEFLASVKIDCLAVDEAHCISKWGHDFRPEYRRLAKTRPSFSSATWIALTATATPQVQNDIKESLGFDSSSEYIGGFDRKNLLIKVIEKKDPYEQAYHFIKRFPNESGIVYCSTRKTTDELYEALRKEGLSVRPYHAGLNDKERTTNQDLFIKDDVNVIVATIAFGMGINKPDVRFVLHYDMPKNIENYYQEIGRAGRDGIRSECQLLFDYGEVNRNRNFIRNKTGHEQRLANIHLESMLNFIYTESCRRIPLLTYFGEDHDGKCGICDNCLSNDKDLVDISIPAQMFFSCVKRTNESFGATHLIDILRGSKSKKVLKFGHDNLSTYGIGKEYTKKQWQHMSRQFLGKRLLIQDMDYGGLSLTAEGLQVMRGKKLSIRRIPEAEAIKKQEQPLEYSSELFEILRTKRKELADAASLPPYVIFHDKTLIEMAGRLPQSMDEFLRIHGVGSAKGEKYGVFFLAAIEEFCLENPPSRKPDEGTEKPRPSSSRGSDQPRYIAIGNMLNSGKTITEIMEYYSIKFETVLDNLNKYSQENLRIKPDELLKYSEVSPELQESVFESFKKHGHSLLRPIFDELDGCVDYRELKILRLFFENRKQ